MKLHFWVATQDDDGECYNIVAKTKKDCLAQMAARTECEWEGPTKSVIEYANAFDLFDWVTGEAGGRRAYG
jgi:hypothetical protein